MNYFHSIVAKLCITEHQSCQEPEILSVGSFLVVFSFLKKLPIVVVSDVCLLLMEITLVFGCTITLAGQLVSNLA